MLCWGRYIDKWWVTILVWVVSIPNIRSFWGWLGSITHILPLSIPYLIDIFIYNTMMYFICVSSNSLLTPLAQTFSLYQVDDPNHPRQSPWLQCLSFPIYPAHPYEIYLCKTYVGWKNRNNNSSFQDPTQPDPNFSSKLTSLQINEIIHFSSCYVYNFLLSAPLIFSLSAFKIPFPLSLFLQLVSSPGPTLMISTPR